MANHNKSEQIIASRLTWGSVAFDALPNAIPLAIIMVVIMMEKCTLKLISTYHFQSFIEIYKKPYFNAIFYHLLVKVDKFTYLLLIGNYKKNCTLREIVNMLTPKTELYEGTNRSSLKETPEPRGSILEPLTNNEKGTIYINVSGLYGSISWMVNFDRFLLCSAPCCCSSPFWIV